MQNSKPFLFNLVLKKCILNIAVTVVFELELKKERKKIIYEKLAYNVYVEYRWREKSHQVQYQVNPETYLTL